MFPNSRGRSSSFKKSSKMDIFRELLFIVASGVLSGVGRYCWWLSGFFYGIMIMDIFCVLLVSAFNKCCSGLIGCIFCHMSVRCDAFWVVM